VLNRLIPLSERGSATELFGDTELGGGVGWSRYSYETVSIVLIFAASIAPETLKAREAQTFRVEDFPIRQNQRISPSSRDIPFSGNGIEIVTINWTKRKCEN